MNQNDVILISIKEMMTVISELSLYLMIPTLIIGLVIAVFQAATQINEQSLSFIPKLIAIFFVIMFYGHYLIDKIANFATDVFSSIPNLVG